MTGPSGAPAVEPGLISVLLPCRNALPWLADAVGSVLAQRDVSLELIVVDNGSSDGSLAWLEACARALAARGDDALPAPADYYDDVIAQAAAGSVPWEAAACRLLSPEQVAALAAPTARLRVLSVVPRGASGQGLALNTAFAVARGELIGEMEADDLRPPAAFAQLRDALRAHPDWDGATSRIALAGWPEAVGMRRWMAWQNRVGEGGPHQLAHSRYIEIPAQRAAGLYRRSALARLGEQPYRDVWLAEDGVSLVDLAQPADQAAAAPLPGWWPVDSDFFGRWFAEGLRLGKVASQLYVWRQYPTQSTRTHSRCSQERLRSSKAYFLAQQGGPAERAAAPGGTAYVELWACGQTSTLWLDALQQVGVRVRLVTWRPGEPAPRVQARVGEAAGAHCDARLWAFGMESARQKVRKTAPGGFAEGEHDWFIA